MNNYFLIGSVVGLFSEALISYLFLRQSYFELFTNSAKSGVFPILIGSLGLLAMGYFFDKIWPYNKVEFFKTAIIKPWIIFITGVLVGVLVNYFQNRSLDSDAFFNFFIKPVAWIMPLGSLLATAIGVGYFLIRVRIK